LLLAKPPLKSEQLEYLSKLIYLPHIHPQSIIHHIENHLIDNKLPSDFKNAKLAELIVGVEFLL